jgi:predicted DNA-binding transcriptional regulator AlpA
VSIDQTKAHGQAIAAHKRETRNGQRFLTKAEVQERVKLSYSAIWLKMNRDEFPRPRVTGPGNNQKVMWLESDIDEWMDGLPVQTYKSDAEREKAAARKSRRA